MLMTMHNNLHPNSNVDRLYLTRKDSERGLLGVEGTLHIETTSLQSYVKSIERLLISFVAMEDDEIDEPEVDLE